MILSKTRSDRRDRRLCRFGVMLVVCSLLINMVAVPKAKAVVIDATAAFGAAAATAAINGTTATTLFTGMSTSAATTAMTTLMGEYATATGVAASGSAFAASIGASAVVTAAGALVIGAAAGYAVYKFIEWLREEKGLEAGGDSIVYYNSKSVELGDGQSVILGTYDAETNTYSSEGATLFEIGTSYVTSTGYSFQMTGPDSSGWFFFKYGGRTNPFSGFVSSPMEYYYFVPFDSLYLGYVAYSSGRSELTRFNITTSSLFGDVFDADSSLEPKPEFQEIPQELPEGQVLKIDTGIESLSVDDPQAAADAIMQTAIDGNLSPTVTVEADPTATPEPEPEPSPDPDAPELPSNLGDLGEALTTRFPFSIPWDIARAIKLIAAPAKAPYWEVDFLAPIAYRLPEGWKGSTKIVLDFGQPEYEIIGIASRWTSTIGFCLALAAATKRFIWTA